MRSGTLHTPTSPGKRTNPGARASMRGRAVVVLLAVIATVVGLAQTALAAYAVNPVGPAWVPNGAVDAVLVNGGTVYVGGEFTGGYAALSADSGQLQWLGNADGSVRALALAGDGTHLLIGGAFNAVGGATHRKLASVNLTDGSVNTTYKAAAGGTVRDIVVMGGTEYFAGAFTNHGGMTQQGLGAVTANTGTLVTTFTPTANGTVYALATDGTRLFLGGGFTTVNGQPRDQLASVTSTAFSDWHAVPSDSVKIPPGGRTSWGMPTSQGDLLLRQAKRVLYPGTTVNVTFTFAKAGSVTFAVPIELSTSPPLVTVPPVPSSSVPV